MPVGVAGLASGKEVLMKSPEKNQAGSPRWQVRGKEEFTDDELVRLQQKLEGWMQEGLPKTATKRSRHQFVMKPRHTGRGT
jgi:hypothetical protein